MVSPLTWPRKVRGLAGFGAEDDVVIIDCAFEAAGLIRGL